MKKFIFIMLVACVAFIGCEQAAEASRGRRCDRVIVQEEHNAGADIVLGAKVDAPNLVKVMDDVFVGVEGGKDLVNTDAGEGWFAYLKVTVTKNLFDFTKE